VTEWHPPAEFQRAPKNGNVWVADAVARELPAVSLQDALRLVHVADAPASGAMVSSSRRRRDRWPDRALLDHLPVGVLPNDVSLVERPQVAAAKLQSLALSRRAGERPLGDAPVAAYDVRVFPVVDVGYAREASSNALAYLLLPYESPSAGIGASASQTQSSAKKDITASASWRLNASRISSSVLGVTSVEVSIARVLSSSRDHCSLRHRPRQPDAGTAARATARNPSHFTSKVQPQPEGRGPERASIGSGNRRTPRSHPRKTHGHGRGILAGVYLARKQLYVSFRGM
jgi:hypothetical protein